LTVYTKTGDKGSTSLFDGKRVKKYDLRVETYGTFDELNAHMSLCAKYVTSEQNKAYLDHTQELLFCVGAELATESVERQKKLTLVTREDSLTLEGAMDDYLEQLPKVAKFVMPGKSKAAAYLHVARTVSRRAERLLVRLAQEIEVREELLIYVNRLSDFLYTMAREEDFRQDVKETTKTILERYLKANQKEMKEIMMKKHETLTLEYCQELAKAVVEVAEKHVPVNMAIANSEGTIIYQYHMPGTLLVSVDIARKKAYTVIAVKAPTHKLSELIQPGAPLYQIETMLEGSIVTFGGGIPIVNEAGETVGAIGISGGTVEQDIIIAEEALAKVSVG